MLLPGESHAIRVEPSSRCGFSRIRSRPVEGTIRVMQASYAVSWEEPDGSRGAGRLELAGSALRLEGRNGGVPVERVYPLRSISGFHLARERGERLNGRPTLVIELGSSGLLKIASVGQPGIVAELAGRLG